ncbi:tubulin domain-containing protein [Globomyces pollinis-pini]|nr:tubulin domain-containing protein [Globomyces pollinis-pini]
MPREIVTIQSGHSANYVGTHYWNAISQYYNQNLSSDFDDSVLYRLGEANNETTYTPRLVIVDRKGSLGTLKKYGDLYPTTQSNPADMWDGKVDKFEAELIPKNNFLKGLDDSNVDRARINSEDIQTWSDFNGIYYHPNTIFELKSYLHEDTTNQFNYFTQGKNTYADLDFLNELMDDKVRKFLEECDSCQGFQIFATTDDGFSGLTSSMIEYIREEYDKKSILVFGINESSSYLETSMVNHRVQQVNQSLFLHSMRECEALYVPLHIPNTKDLDNTAWSLMLKSNFSSMYERTALVAAGIESLTLPLRLKESSNRLDMRDLHTLAFSTRYSNVSSLAMGVPHMSESEEYNLSSKSNDLNLGWIRDLTLECKFPDITEEQQAWSMFRGFEDAISHQNVELSDIHRVNQDWKDYINSAFPTNANSKNLTFSTPFLMSPSFPQFFKSNINQYGLISQKECEGVVQSFPFMVNLHNGHSLNTLFKKMLSNISFHQSETTLKNDYQQGTFGIDSSEWDEMKEYFVSLVEE